MCLMECAFARCVLLLYTGYGDHPAAFHPAPPTDAALAASTRMLTLNLLNHREKIRARMLSEKHGSRIDRLLAHCANRSYHHRQANVNIVRGFRGHFICVLNISRRLGRRGLLVRKGTGTLAGSRFLSMRRASLITGGTGMEAAIRQGDLSEWGFDDDTLV